MNIFGHNVIQARLARGIEKGVVSHAYLFVGPESVGKYALAFDFALKLTDSQNKKENHIDIMTIAPEREMEKGVEKERDISIENVRLAQKFLQTSPYSGKKKVLIIRDAHRLTEASQNALLKVLEEPRAYAIIILVTHTLEKMLDTIVSRCQKVSFQLLRKEEMEHINQSSLNSSITENYEFIFSLGRPGLYFEFLENPKIFHDRYDVFFQLQQVDKMTLQERLALAENLATHLSWTIKMLEWWMSSFHEITIISEDATSMRRSLLRADRIYSVIDTLKKSVSSSRIVLENFLIHW